MRYSLAVQTAHVSEMRTSTKFKCEFKAFLAGIGFQLKHFLPDDSVDDKMFPEHLIPRATGYEKLRGHGGLTADLAVQWALRSQQFLQSALEKGATVHLDGISFIEYENTKPNVSWQKLMALYDAEHLVPVRIKIDESIDEVKVEEIMSTIHQLVGDIRVAVLRAREGCTEVIILMDTFTAGEIIHRMKESAMPQHVISAERIVLPPRRSLARGFLLEEPAVDLATRPPSKSSPQFGARPYRSNGLFAHGAVSAGLFRHPSHPQKWHRSSAKATAMPTPQNMPDHGDLSKPI